VARAFGDASLKIPPNPVLLCDPEITKCVIQPEDQFVLIACDGLFDVMTSDEAAEYVFDHLVNDEPEIVVQKLVNHAVGELKSFDNVSALLAMINPLRTIHETQLPEDHRINLIPTVDPNMSIDELLPAPKARQADRENGDANENDNGGGGEEEEEELIVTRSRS
jgi:serine/threonine protein phosphatase PrpC